MLVPLLELDPELPLPDGTRLAEALEGLGGRAGRAGRAALIAEPRLFRPIDGKLAARQSAPERTPYCPLSSFCPRCSSRQRREQLGRQDRRRVARIVGVDSHRQLAGRARRDRSRRSSMVIISRGSRSRPGSRRRSARSPPSTPAAIQSSIRWSIPGSAARSARTCSSSASLKRADIATIGAGLHREADRDAELGAGGVAAKRRLVAPQAVPEDPPGGGLELGVAVRLGRLDLGAGAGSAGNSGGSGLAGGRAPARSRASPAPSRRRSSAPGR